MTARANYIISAQDATRDAIRSIQNNFKSLDAGIKTSARGINSALGFLAGAGLKNMFRSALDATAEAAGAQSDFAKALEETRKAASGLMASKQGLPEATQAMRELAATLKDPETQEAFDGAATGIIKIGASVARLGVEYVNLVSKGWKGWKAMLLGEGDDRLVNLDNEILTMQERLKARGGSAETQRHRPELEWQLAERQRAYGLTLEALRPRSLDLEGVTAPGAKSAGNGMAQTAAAEELEKALESLKDTAHLTDETLSMLFSNTGDGIKEDQAAIEQQQKATEYYRTAWDEMKKSGKETDAAIAEMNQQAALQSRDAWKGIFFTAMTDGMDGVLHQWKRTLKEMEAQALASGLVSLLKGDSFFGGVTSSLTAAGKGLGKLLGFANEGSILPGGSGGTDSQVVAFRKSPDEQVDIYRPGKSGGGAVQVNYNIDARGASVDLIKALPGILRAHGDAVKADVLNGLRRGLYS